MELNYTDADGLVGRVVITGMFVLLTGAGLLMLFAATDGFVANPSAAPAALFVLGAAVAALFGPIACRIAAIGWRSTRGGWWLRLTATGFEVNDRVFTPRRFGWGDIDRFMLVAPASQIEHAVVTPGATFTQSLSTGGDPIAALRVGFHCAPGYRRPLASRVFRPFTAMISHDGTQADGLIMGYWDRPFDEAVDLMNDWLTRYRKA